MSCEPENNSLRLTTLSHRCTRVVGRNQANGEQHMEYPANAIVYVSNLNC